MLGHLDTVWPVGTLAGRPFRARGRQAATGPGVFDMKAGLAIAAAGRCARSRTGVRAAPGRDRAARDQRRGDRQRDVAARRSKTRPWRSEAVLVLEPSLPGGALKTSRKGCGEFVLRVDGRAPRTPGSSRRRAPAPFSELARQILAHRSAAGPRRAARRSTSASSGAGPAPTSSPPRPRPSSTCASRRRPRRRRVTGAMRALRPADPRTRLTRDRRRRPAPDRAHAGGRGAVPPARRPWRRTSGATLGEGATGGGSDGNLTAALGVPTLDGLGAVGGGRARRSTSTSTVGDLPWRAALVAGLLRRILARLDWWCGGSLQDRQSWETQSRPTLAARADERRAAGARRVPRRVRRPGDGVRLRRHHELRARTGSPTRSCCGCTGRSRSGPEHPLYQITARLAQRAGLPMPKVYVIPDPSPNAFATGRNPSHAAVAATEGILRMLDERELEGVIAHELAHVKHRDILISSIAATMAAAIMMMARMAQFAALFGGRPAATTAKAGRTRSRCWRRSSSRRSRPC